MSLLSLTFYTVHFKGRNKMGENYKCVLRKNAYQILNNTICPSTTTLKWWDLWIVWKWAAAVEPLKIINRRKEWALSWKDYVPCVEGSSLQLVKKKTIRCDSVKDDWSPKTIGGTDKPHRTQQTLSGRGTCPSTTYTESYRITFRGTIMFLAMRFNRSSPSCFGSSTHEYLSMRGTSSRALRMGTSSERHTPSWVPLGLLVFNSTFKIPCGRCGGKSDPNISWRIDKYI